ncbi:MAG: outer membrane lipoprotein-sorting protein [Myxococcota bacterium]|nr:outer membrane lipoprotein-sorting protein [Myxococcota bacterium]
MSVSAIILAALMVPSAPTGRDIAKAMEDVDDGSTQYSIRMMLSCEFAMKKGKRACTSKPRKKVIEGVQMDTGKDGKDSISMSYILEPAAEKGMAFKQYDYKKARDSSEQWMYMPALKKLKRVVSDSSSGPRTGTLFGSEIAYEDIEQRDLDDYEHTLVGEETLDGKAVYVLESRPIKARRTKTSYGKSKVWVAKDTYLALKNELYDHKGTLVKTFFFKDIQQVSGIWISRKMAVVNHRNSRMSMLALKKLAVNPPMDEGIFDTRVLDDSAYREKLLNPIRQAAQ